MRRIVVIAIVLALVGVGLAYAFWPGNETAFRLSIIAKFTDGTSSDVLQFSLVGPEGKAIESLTFKMEGRFVSPESVDVTVVNYTFMINASSSNIPAHLEKKLLIKAEHNFVVPSNQWTVLANEMFTAGDIEIWAEANSFKLGETIDFIPYYEIDFKGPKSYDPYQHAAGTFAGISVQWKATQIVFEGRA